jgi:hypothetical protein
MSYAEIGELTLPQVRCILTGGKSASTDVLEDEAEVRDWMQLVAAGVE